MLGAVLQGDAPAAIHENLLSTSAIGTIHSLDRIFELKNLLSASTWNEHGMLSFSIYTILRKSKIIDNRLHYLFFHIWRDFLHEPS
jgi:hypothetical protein